MRLSMELSSGWEFAPDLDGPAFADSSNPSAPQQGWRPITVPGFWQPQFREFSNATGAAWYRTDFDLGEDWITRSDLRIEFGAVAYFCQVWCNDVYVGDHQGGNLPFSLSVDLAARVGSNRLVIRVVTPSGDRNRYPEFPFEETLHGKQSWYGPLGGIWQPVHVVARSGPSVEIAQVSADAENGAITVVPHLNQTSLPASEDVRIELTVVDPSGATVAQAVGTHAEPVTVQLDPVTLQWWSVDAPHLYTVVARTVIDEKVSVARVGDDGVLDETTRRCGFRTFVADEGRFLLNGEPLIMRGLLDQDYWDGPGTMPSTHLLRAKFRAIKAMGFNTLRVHIKVPDPRYLDIADEEGVLIWCEPPTTSRLSPAARERLVDTIDAMIDRDHHHPSVVVWGIANEAWGYDLVGNPEHRQWLQGQYLRLKGKVSDRLIVDNSPCRPNFHLQSDIEDYHFYAVIPEMRQRWDDFIDAFAKRQAPTYSPFGDAVRTGNEPLVISEFGAWGLPDLSDIEGDEPWWFESGQEWADGAAYLHGALDRFRLWHLDRAFGSWRNLTVQTQRRQFATMRYQIETMRERSIAGYVLTELGDVHWESNGIFDMLGRPRTFTSDLATVNADRLAIARAEPQVVGAGDEIVVTATFCNHGEQRSDLSIRWRNNDGDVVLEASLGPVAPYAVVSATPLVMVADATTRAGAGDTPFEHRLRCEIVGPEGEAASAEATVTEFPRHDAPVTSAPELVVDDAPLASALAALGCPVSSDGDGLIVTHQLTDGDHAHIHAGGSALVLARDIEALGGGFGDFPPVQVRPWREALFGGGEWVSAFSWLSRAGSFADLPGPVLLDGRFEGLTPDHVVTGIPPARFDYDVEAGVFVGWVHQVAAMIARHNVGSGSIIICTFDLATGVSENNPLAIWLLRRLVTMAGRDELPPHAQNGGGADRPGRNEHSQR